MAVFWVVAPRSLVEHGATTQKTAIFLLTAVRTSNPTSIKESDCRVLHNKTTKNIN
jgi:hypothetical protein